MYDISLFMANNLEPVQTEKYVATQRLKDADGNPLEWTIKPVSSEINDSIRKDCMKWTNGPKGKRGRADFDVALYTSKLAAACTVEPNLYDAGLQDSYGVMSAEALLHAILAMPGEYDSYSAKVQEVCGFEDAFAEDVNEVKN